MKTLSGIKSLNITISDKDKVDHSFFFRETDTIKDIKNSLLKISLIEENMNLYYNDKKLDINDTLDKLELPENAAFVVRE